MYPSSDDHETTTRKHPHPLLVSSTNWSIIKSPSLQTGSSSLFFITSLTWSICFTVGPQQRGCSFYIQLTPSWLFVIFWTHYGTHYQLWTNRIKKRLLQLILIIHMKFYVYWIVDQTDSHLYGEIRLNMNNLKSDVGSSKQVSIRTTKSHEMCSEEKQNIFNLYII